MIVFLGMITFSFFYGYYMYSAIDLFNRYFSKRSQPISALLLILLFGFLLNKILLPEFSDTDVDIVRNISVFTFIGGFLLRLYKDGSINID